MKLKRVEVTTLKDGSKTSRYVYEPDEEQQQKEPFPWFTLVAAIIMIVAILVIGYSL